MNKEEQRRGQDAVLARKTIPVTEPARGFRVCCMAQMLGMQKRLESFVRCDEHVWPDSGGPSNQAVQGGKATLTNSLGLGFRV